MKQFTTILKFELLQYLKNKIFVGLTLFLVIAIGVVMFFPRLTADSDSAEPIPPTVDSTPDTDTAPDDETEINADRPLMLIGAEDPQLANRAKDVFAQSFPTYTVQVSTEDTEQISAHISAGEAACAFFLTSPTSYTYYVNNLSMYDTNTVIADEVLQTVYRMNAMIGGGISPEDAANILAVSIEHEVLNLGKDQMQNFFYTYIMIFALYMVILLYGQMVATNVATEKSSRAMELLVTSAKPTSMMFGKVIASCLAGLLQLVAVFGAAFVCFNLNRAYWEDNDIVTSIFDIPLDILLYMLLFFILGFFIYAFLYGAIGSMASKVEDINTSSLPLTFLFIAAFMVVVVSMAGGSVDNTAMIVCSYIPFTSPMAMFTRIAMSTVPIYEILISVAILIASVFGIGVLSAKIYRVGVLLYGTPPKFGAILKAIRRA